MYAKTIVLQKQGIPNCYVAYFGDLHSRVTIMISNSFFCYNIILFKPTTFIEPYKCCTLQWKWNMTINVVNISILYIFSDIYVYVDIPYVYSWCSLYHLIRNGNHHSLINVLILQWYPNYKKQVKVTPKRFSLSHSSRLLLASALIGKSKSDMRFYCNNFN